MFSNLHFSRIVFFSSILAAIAYIASYILWFNSGITLNISIKSTLELAAQRPGLWGIGYFLQATAFLLWALTPIEIGQKYRNSAPGLSQLTLIAGSFGFAWRAMTDFARAGSIEYFGQLYASNDPTMRSLAERLAAWTQLWTFGAVWEIIGNSIAFGVFAFLVGLLIVSRHKNYGWAVTLLGGLAALSLIGTSVYYIVGIRTGLNIISIPGFIAIFTAPLWIAWFAWLADRNDENPKREEMAL
jgi:hypothetical protein